MRRIIYMKYMIMIKILIRIYSILVERRIRGAMRKIVSILGFR
jgi:hypothetical protein